MYKLLYSNGHLQHVLLTHDGSSFSTEKLPTKCVLTNSAHVLSRNDPYLELPYQYKK